MEPTPASGWAARMRTSVDELVFVDTNILLYAVDRIDPVKQARAAAWLDSLWKSGRGRLSWQVLSEFNLNAVKMMDASPEETRERVELLAEWQPTGMTLGLAQRAWFWSDSAKLSYWDALIVAAAERAGCRWLLSEDFEEGRSFGGVTVMNPFTRAPGEV